MTAPTVYQRWFQLRYQLRFQLRYQLRFTPAGEAMPGFRLAGAGLRGFAFFEISICGDLG
jgi:hypothetical protein